eukprot:GILI01021370.1.p1 GENE.GILI01021370.1~~GILI01021370.1.p1  ORF type:complete len:276 (-),score=32.94 GILI01021370.1:37-864(-)
MPLGIFCGIPSSGKTTRALQIKAHLESLGHTVCLLNEESLELNKNEAYKDVPTEKNTRASFKAHVDRMLTRNIVVLLDTMNYIKGYRYELHCIARSIQTPHCVVYCQTPVELAREWNAQREAGYSLELFNDLAGRLEVPDSKNRWDRPCFDIRPEEETPLEEITAALIEGRAPRPPVATVPTKLSETNLLFELDQITQDILAALEAAQTNSFIGDTITLPHCDQKLRLSRKMSSLELRRLRTQYLKIARMHPPSSTAVIGPTFLEYITTNMDAQR